MSPKKPSIPKIQFVRAGLVMLLLSACQAAPAAAPAPSAATSAPATEAAAAAPTDNAAAPVASLNSNNPNLRKLEGKLTIAVQGALPVEGAPETATQTAWREILERYKSYQPGVEVVIEDLPQGQTGEQWCETRKQTKQMPDITYVGECNYFRPTQEEIQRGLNIAMDFKPYENEANPYTGAPWKDDWFDDVVRTSRCTEQGAYNMWTCQTTGMTASGIWVNWDILKEFGYDHTFPATYTELYALADKINASGKYVAWDMPSYPAYWFAWIGYTVLTMDRYTKAGGDIANMQESNPKALGNPNSTVQWCDGNYTTSNNPDIQEALKQWKRLVDSFPGGGAAFWDPARDQTGAQWLSGQAAMSFQLSGFYGAMKQAEKDSVLMVKDWDIQTFPNITQEDLFDKSIKISFDGQPFMLSSGGGDVFAPTPNVRASGEDTNVDNMVLDWFQFMSAEGIGILSSHTGSLSLNPKIVDKAEPKLKKFLSIKPEVFKGVSQPPGTYSNEPIYTADTEKNMQAWSAGQVDFETATKKADENIRRTVVKRYEDAMKEAGYPPLPASCDPYRTQ